jgi:hypothetical protein
MKLRINASTPVLRRYLDVDEAGVTYCETAALGGVRHIAYADIDGVVRDHTSVAIQIGLQIYKLPYKRDNREHTQAITMLVEGCRRTMA